jgi:hypothetical protein
MALVFSGRTTGSALAQFKAWSVLPALYLLEGFLLKIIDP